MADGARRFPAPDCGWGRYASRHHVAAVVDMNGGLLGVESFPTTGEGHRSLSSWMAGFGTLERVLGSRAPARMGPASHDTFQGRLCG